MLDKRPVPRVFTRMAVADVENLVTQVRDHYVAKFRSFLQGQQASCTTGAAEVKFSLEADTAAFHRLAVVDFVRNDDGPEGVLFEPESFLTFDRVEGNIAKTALVIEGLRWDATVIHHDVPYIADAIEEWFRKWFDPDEIRLDHAADLSNCIHAVYIELNELQVDFGTAPTEAFWELLDSLAAGNATSVNVRS